MFIRYDVNHLATIVDALNFLNPPAWQQTSDGFLIDYSFYFLSSLKVKVGDVFRLFPRKFNFSTFYDAFFLFRPNERHHMYY